MFPSQQARFSFCFVLVHFFLYIFLVTIELSAALCLFFFLAETVDLASSSRLFFVLLPFRNPVALI